MFNLRFPGALVVGLLITAVIFLATALQTETVATSRLESISGTDFPISSGNVLVQERLAHADIFVGRSVLGQELELELSVRPGNLQRLEVGVREDSFWLSYGERQPVFIRKAGVEISEPLTAVVKIPLTDKLQEPDGSVDLMFWAATSAEQPLDAAKLQDITQWELQQLNAAISPVLPSSRELKNYVRAFIDRERAL